MVANILKFTKGIGFWSFFLMIYIGTLIYRFVVEHYPLIIGFTILYFLYVKRNSVLKVIKYLWNKKSSFKKVLPKNETEMIQDIIDEIKSKGKLTDKDRNNIDLLNIKLKQLQSV